MNTLLHLANAGAGNLAAYLAAHVLLCLLPAFFIAGAMAALIPKASITRWLGRNAPGRVSYPAAAAAGSLLAVCSCTIVPLFAGIYGRAPGSGRPSPSSSSRRPATSGTRLHRQHPGRGVRLRALGPVPPVRHRHRLLMALLFWRDDASHDATTDTAVRRAGERPGPRPGVLLALVAVLIAGTLKLWPLTATIGTVTLPLPWARPGRTRSSAGSRSTPPRAKRA
jgi:hypothetical protein